jgi:hypothetical protein
MAGASGQGGMAAGLASQAASRVRNAGQWLDDRGPGQVADEMQSFARRRPAVFLALAAGAGLVAGRLTRGLKDANNGLSASASGLPPKGGDPAWEAGPAYGERHPLVTDDQAGGQGTL